MKKNRVLFSLLMTIVAIPLIAGYNRIQEDEKMLYKSAMDASASAKGGDDHGGTEAKLAGTRIDLQGINSLKPGNVTLAFKLYGLDTHEFGPKDLKIKYEKPLHLLLVSSELRAYQHLHPSYVNGRWTVATQIPQSGNYNLYVDIEPIEESPIVLRLPIVVGKPTQKKNFPTPSQNFSETLGNLKVKIDLRTSIKTKEVVALKFNITQNNKPVTKIDPYLGGFGHVVIMSHTDPGHFEHAHPVKQVKPSNGQVEFEATFPANGMYTIFAQFSIGGQVKTFPVTINVGNEKNTKKDAHM